jgi:hypothetical protein
MKEIQGKLHTSQILIEIMIFELHIGERQVKNQHHKHDGCLIDGIYHQNLTQQDEHEICQIFEKIIQYMLIGYHLKI